MDIFDLVRFYGKLQEMKALLSEVSNKELRHKLDKKFQWLMEHSDCKKTDTVDIM